MIDSRSLFYLSLFFLLSCRQEQKKALFTAVDNSQIHFINTLEESKEMNVFRYRNFYNGGGVGTGDLNNDGLPEVFFTANQSANKLFLNKGNFKFEDITEKSGISYQGEWSTGVVFVDINADGWLDIYVCNAGNMLNKALRKNKLYINNHNLTFTENAAAYGLDNDGYSTQASFFDYDKDGDLDCFLVNNSPIPVNTLNYANMRNIPDSAAPYAEFLKGGGDHLYRNDNGKFIDVTQQAGIYGSIISFGLGVTIGDVNEDGYPDVYVSNDFFEKDYLYINQQDGSFKDEIESRTQHISFSSMGADMQDINNDGKQDIFTTDMLPDNDYRLKTNTSFEGYDVYKLKQDQGFFNQFTQNSLQVNDGQGHFLETGFFSGVAASDWSWGALMFDADNDGRADIFVSNGIYRDVTDQDFIDFFANEVVAQMALGGKKEEVENVINKMPSVPIANKFFRNIGGLRFSDDGNAMGLGEESFSNGSSYADLDNDGDLDLLVNNVNQDAMVYRNNSREQFNSAYLALTLRYKSPNIFAVGSRVRVFCGEEILMRELIPSRGFQSSVDYKIVIGLGGRKPDSVQVTWPDGATTTLLSPAANTTLNVDFLKSTVREQGMQKSNADPVFELTDFTTDSLKEDDFIDFYAERNIPFMLSRLGPDAAVGDVNGDGFDDLFIGGPAQTERKLFIQQQGRLVQKPVEDFKRVQFNDVNEAFFLDADQDGDQDLFTGGGGNMQDANAELYQNLLFINDGKGDFKLKPGTFPLTHTNCGAAIALDFDQDGKLDIISGSRSVPQNYGQAPQSFLYRNKGNAQYEDVTQKLAPFLKDLGMITALEWTDLTGDGQAELIIAGEWMEPQVYEFRNGAFRKRKSGLEGMHGWWQGMHVLDLDGDGDQDLVLGNFGQNFYLRPDSTHPVKLWIKDFDKNGSVEKVFTHRIDGKDMPVFLKKELTDQVPSLKKLNLKHRDYATKSVQDLFGEDILNAKELKITEARSVVAINDGKGNFSVRALPVEMQLSSFSSFAAVDLDEDGDKDLICGGNFSDLLPQFCRVDASYSQVLFNDGKGGFRVASPAERGIYVGGQVRSLETMRLAGKQHAIFMINNEPPELYRIRSTIKPERK